MQIESHVVSRFEQGVVLDVIAHDLSLCAYVAVSPPDPHAVTEFVPREQFESEGNLHVAAVGTIDEAAGVVEDVLFNMEAGDAVAFLCADMQALQATLDALGHAGGASPLE